MHRHLSALSCIAVLALSSLPAWGAPKSASLTPIQRNVQQLLKTKSCPSCDLAGVDLSQNRLNKADLQGANLSGARLNLADLSGANLRHANLSRANLTGADLSYADLEGANLQGIQLDGARFQATRIKGRTVNRLIHAENAQSNVDEHTITSQQLMAAQEPRPTAKPATPPSRAEATDKNVNELPAPAAGTTTDTQPSDSMLQAVDAELPARPVAAASKPAPPPQAEQPAAAPGKSVNEARQRMLERMFDKKSCIGCNLRGLDLSGQNMSGFDLERADFSDSNLQKADLNEANLKGAIFQGTQLQGADLSETDLYRADFTTADLTEADLDEAKTEGADFSGAIGLAPATGGAAQ